MYAVVYVVNDDNHQLDMMMNSINSFCFHNPDLIDKTDIIILTDRKITLDRLNKIALDRIRIISGFSYDYSRLPMKQRHTHYSYVRYEIFANKTFLDYDVVLYADTDTVFMSKFDLLETDATVPKIFMVPEHRSFIDQKKYKNRYYCNSGMICLTPSAIGKKRMFDLFMDFILYTRFHPEFQKHDQDVINAVLALPKYSRLLQPVSCKYNYNYATATDKPCSDISLRHYITQEKYDLTYLK